MDIIELGSEATQIVEFTPKEGQLFSFSDGLHGKALKPKNEKYKDKNMTVCAIELDGGGYRSILKISTVN